MAERVCEWAQFLGSENTNKTIGNKKPSPIFVDEDLPQVVVARAGCRPKAAAFHKERST
jgi:hypothetical protein